MAAPPTLAALRGWVVEYQVAEAVASTLGGGPAAARAADLRHRIVEGYTSLMMDAGVRHPSPPASIDATLLIHARLALESRAAEEGDSGTRQRGRGVSPPPSAPAPPTPPPTPPAPPAASTDIFSPATHLHRILPFMSPQHRPVLEALLANRPHRMRAAAVAPTVPAQPPAPVSTEHDGKGDGDAAGDGSSSVRLPSDAAALSWTWRGDAGPRQAQWTRLSPPQHPRVEATTLVHGGVRGVEEEVADMEVVRRVGGVVEEEVTNPHHPTQQAATRPRRDDVWEQPAPRLEAWADGLHAEDRDVGELLPPCDMNITGVMLDTHGLRHGTKRASTIQSHTRTATVPAPDSAHVMAHAACIKPATGVDMDAVGAADGSTAPVPTRRPVHNGLAVMGGGRQLARAVASHPVEVGGTRDRDVHPHESRSQPAAAHAATAATLRRPTTTVSTAPVVVNEYDDTVVQPHPDACEDEVGATHMHTAAPVVHRSDWQVSMPRERDHRHAHDVAPLDHHDGGHHHGDCGEPPASRGRMGMHTRLARTSTGTTATGNSGSRTSHSGSRSGGAPQLHHHPPLTQASTTLDGGGAASKAGYVDTVEEARKRAAQRAADRKAAEVAKAAAEAEAAARREAAKWAARNARISRFLQRQRESEAVAAACQAAALARPRRAGVASVPPLMGTMATATTGSAPLPAHLPPPATTIASLHASGAGGVDGTGEAARPRRRGPRMVDAEEMLSQLSFMAMGQQPRPPHASNQGLDAFAHTSCPPGPGGQPEGAEECHAEWGGHHAHVTGTHPPRSADPVPPTLLPRHQGWEAGVEEGELMSQSVLDVGGNACAWLCGEDLGDMDMTRAGGFLAAPKRLAAAAATDPQVEGKATTSVAPAEVDSMVRPSPPHAVEGGVAVGPTAHEAKAPAAVAGALDATTVDILSATFLQEGL